MQNKISSDFNKLYQAHLADTLSIIKQNILGVISLIFFIIFSTQLSKLMTTIQPSIQTIINVVLSLIGGLIFLFFMLFVIDNKKLFVWICLILLGIACPFYKSFLQINLYSLLGLGCSILLIFWGSYQMHNEATNYIKFNWRRFIKAGANYIVFSIIVFSMFVLYQEYTLKTQNTKFSLLDYSFFVIEKTSSFMPFKPPINNTIDNLLTNTMSNSFINNYIGVSQLGALGTNTKNINDLLKNNVSSILHIKITGQETISDIIKQYALSASTTTKYIISAILIIIIFGICNLISILLNIIIVPLGWFILQILLWTKFFKFKTINVEQQILSIQSE